MNIQAVLIVRDDKETSLLVGYFLLSKESSRRWCHSSACKMNARPERVLAQKIILHQNLRVNLFSRAAQSSKTDI